MDGPAFFSGGAGLTALGARGHTGSMKRACLTAGLAGLLIAVSTVRSEGGGWYDPKQNHDRIISRVLSEAADQRKRVLVEVGMDECPSVRQLDALLARDQEIAAALDQGFVHLRFSIYGADQSKWIKSHLPPLRATPSLFVLDESGRLLYTQEPTTLESGRDYDRVKVKKFLEKWATPDRTQEAIAQTRSLMPEIMDLASPKITAAELPVVVYYYSPKSSEGKELTATLENISVDYAGRAEFFSIDTDRAGPAAFPRLVLIKGGKRRSVPLPEKSREEDKIKATLDAWLSR